MAQATENVLNKGFSGSIDKMLTFRQRSGKTFVGKKRRRNEGPPSEQMLTVRARFTACVAYAKKAIRDLKLKALYHGGRVGSQSAFNVATADAFNAPVVKTINPENYHGAVGDIIAVDAVDDFKVVKVLVSVHNAAGTLIEEGNASLDPVQLEWFYTSTVANPALAGSKITATATDLPGNSASLEITLQ